MGFGHSFPEKLIPGMGEVVVNKDQFKAFNVKAGDHMMLRVEMDNGDGQNLLFSMIKNPLETAGKESYVSDATHMAGSQCRKVLFPVKVVGIVDEIGFGKFGSDNKFTFVMSSKHFMEHIHQFCSQKLKRNAIFDNLWSANSLKQLSTHIFFNMPDRLSYYLTLNYATIQVENLQTYDNRTHVHCSVGHMIRELMWMKHTASIFDVLLRYYVLSGYVDLIS